jgi:hypothetical protein
VSHKPIMIAAAALLRGYTPTTIYRVLPAGKRAVR